MLKKRLEFSKLQLLMVLDIVVLERKKNIMSDNLL